MAAEQVKVLVSGHSYIRRLQDDTITFAMAQCRVQLHGTSGGTIKQALADLRCILPTTCFLPDILVLQLGENDITNSCNPEDVYNNYICLVNACFNRGVKQVVVCSLYPRWNPRQMSRQQYARKQAAINVLLSGISQSTKAIFWQHKRCHGPLNKEVFLPDGVHLTPRMMVPFFKSLRGAIMKGQVMHSQRLSETSLLPWAIIQPDGKVLAAHCNCMAGLGESCTHIAAMLFSIEASVKVRESRTVTEEKAYWLPASLKSVTYSQIRDIDFTSAKSKKKILDSRIAGIDVPARRQFEGSVVEEPSPDMINGFLAKLSQTGYQSAILTVKQPFNKEFVPQSLSDRFPKILLDLFNQDLLESSFSDIIRYCKTVKITVSQDESNSVENSTVQQTKSKLWNKFRSGRITALRMYAACHSNPASPSHSLVMAMCNPERVKFSSSATSWGCNHEKAARESYEREMSKSHEHFVVQDSGFKINPDYPALGASPDGLVSCDCCGVGVLEIKCPFCARFESLNDYVGKSSSCLESTSDGKQLKLNHPYYYQVQTQIHVCKTEYCDFVVWTERDMHLERIEPDLNLWTEISQKACDFHEMAVMPELVARFFSRQNTPAPLRNRDPVPSTSASNNDLSGELFCICQQPETTNNPMVACDNQNCSYQWFHLSCLKISKSQLPKGKWYCPDCLMLPEFSKKRCKRQLKRN